MNKAIFLDRDGVINRKGPGYYVSKEEDFVFNNGVFEALRYFSSKGYLLIVITNQGGIARGAYTIEDVEKIHAFMKTQLSLQGIELTDIFYCPHHPEISKCDCRKPGTLLFEQAVSKYNIDPQCSVMIGDSAIDVHAAENMEMRGILLPVNGNMMDIIRSGLVR